MIWIGLGIVVAIVAFVVYSILTAETIGDDHPENNGR